MGAKNVLAFRARAGFIQGDAPYSQLFTLGGLIPYVVMKMINSVVRRCTMLHWNSVSQLLKKVSGVLFSDIGDAWDAPNVTWYNSKKTFNYGVGAGVRITTPIGPVKLDYGVGKHKNKFHFSFGTQF